MINKGMMSSNRDDWRTPIDLFRQLDAVFCFDLDVAADNINHLCSDYYTADDSAFDHGWGEIARCAWCNPPYGRGLYNWIAECDAQSHKADPCSVVALLPARTDTAVWRHHVWPTADAICFLYGRLKFDDGNGTAPFPSALVVFGRGISNAEINKLAHLGRWVKL